jgi:hypothetical protein
MNYQPEVMTGAAGHPDRGDSRSAASQGTRLAAAGARAPGTGQPPARPPRRQALARVAVAGAHGGAGVSTLAALLAPSWDLGPVRGKTAPPLPAGVPVVLAARCTVASAARAAAAVRLLDGHGVAVAVLAVTGDGLPEPAEAAYRFRVLEGRVGAVVRVPFIPALRAAGDPRQVRLPRRAVRALSEIRSLAAVPGGPGNQPATRQ